MKIFFTSILTLFTITLISQSNLNTKASSFYNQVVKDGLVDYKWIKENPASLKELLTLIEQETLTSDWSSHKEFLLNAYNILVIHQIVENYPLNSPLDVSGFYDKTKFNIAGESWTLDYLENEVIRPNYNDARVHFALVCGALGQNENKLMVSEIFKWFEGDFGGKSNVISYINMFRDQKFSKDLKIDYYPYDWSLNDSNSVKSQTSLDAKEVPAEQFNLQTFTGGSLLKKGQADITLFNTIYTQSKSNWAGTRFSGFRESFYTHSLQGTFGVSNSGRFNLGAEINFKASGRSVDSTAASVTQPLDYSNSDSTRVGISNVGLRLRFQPFKSEPDFSIQSTFFIPTVKNAEGLSGQESSVDDRYFLDWDRYVWWNQFFYSKSFSDFQVFSSVETLFRFGKNEFQSSSVDLPAKVFFSYFPNNKITLYAMTEHVPRFRYNANTTPESIADQNTHSGNYTASGAGFKYQFGQNLNVELLYTNFWRSKYAGLGNTFNVGIKYLIL